MKASGRKSGSRSQRSYAVALLVSLATPMPAANLGKASSSTENEAHLKEWAAARDVLKQFDDRIHDLRKYGFSFVTALLTAQAFLIPGVAALLAKQAPIPETTKAAVLSVTIFLIVGLQVIEKNYLLIQEAAAMRARILERSLNLELSDIITDKLRKARPKVRAYANYVYYILIAGVFGLGLSILGQDLLAWSILIIATVVALLWIRMITSRLKLFYKWDKRMIDWTISPIDCDKNDKVGITITHLGGHEISFKQGELMWEVQTQDGNSIHTQKAEAPITIKDEGHYTWLWDTRDSKVKPDEIYRVLAFGHDPLRRTIRVRKPVAMT